MRSGIETFQPERLKQARATRGLTLTALAQISSVSAPTLSRWEAGLQKPETLSLESVSEALNFPLNFFMKPVPEYGDQPAFFRSNCAATKTAREVALTKLKWLNEISLEIQDYINFPEVKVKPIGERDYLKISDEDIEEIALECRRLFALGLGPISDTTLFMENAGVIMVRDCLGHIKMDGVSKWFSSDQRPYVYLAADKANSIRSRFDAAHELGHIVLHRYVSEIDFNKRHKIIEAQADRFAGAFLLPAESFSNEVYNPSLDTFLALKKRWKVSIAAMIFRSKQLGIIDENYALRLWKSYSARGWRRGEPLDQDIPFEKIRLVPRAVSMLIENSIYSKASFLDVAALSADDCADICSLPKGYFSDAPSNILSLELLRLNEKKVKDSKANELKNNIVAFPNARSGNA